jgi:hypothetical protein
MIALAEAVKNTKNAMVRTLKIFLTFLLFTIGYSAAAQVTIKIDEKINEQLRMKNALIDSTKLKGYRIQIAFSKNKSEVENIAASFKSYYPEYNTRVYKVYQSPYWKIRVGDFYRPLDALKLLDELLNHSSNKFERSILVKESIRRPQL